MTRILIIAGCSKKKLPELIIIVLIVFIFYLIEEFRECLDTQKKIKKRKKLFLTNLYLIYKEYIIKKFNILIV